MAIRAAVLPDWAVAQYGGYGSVWDDAVSQCRDETPAPTESDPAYRFNHRTPDRAQKSLADQRRLCQRLEVIIPKKLHDSSEQCCNFGRAVVLLRQVFTQARFGTGAVVFGFLPMVTYERHVLKFVSG
jgi:hypothetical protein